MLRIGLRAHDYGAKCLPEELAARLAVYKPASVQLALAKVFTNAPPDGSLSPGYARAIRGIFSKQGIAIAVLGCYINPVHPDAGAREKELRRFEEHLRYARDFDCPLVGTETGSRSPDCSYHPNTEKPEVFDLLCVSIERLVSTAEKCGSIVAVEAVADQHTVSSIELMQKLLERFPSPALKVIYDPVNLIPKTGLPETQEVFFKRAFEAFGDRIAAVHAKDFCMENGVKRGTLPAGSGSLDYKTLLPLILRHKPGIDILLENNSPDHVEKTMRFFASLAPR
jgi:sugar phosphate isomerase/epimerase